MSTKIISDFIDFKNEVVRSILGYLPADYEGSEVELKDVVKNNDQRFTGLVVKRAGSNIAPNIYLEEFYKDYENGKTIEEVIGEIADLRVKHEVGSMDVSYVTDYEECRDRVVPRLVNADMNRELLKERPYRVIEDLAVVYAIDLDENMSIPVSRQMMEKWSIDEEELYSDSIRNLPDRLPSSLKSIGEVLRGMMPASDFEDMGMDLFPADSGFFVLSNTRNVHGAASLLDRKIMEEITERIGNFYILPSSIHEVLIIPSDNGIEVNILRNMVIEVNRSTVSESEKLSDSVYCYSSDKGLIRVDDNNSAVA